MTYLSTPQGVYLPAGGLERITQYHGTISTLEAAVQEYAPIVGHAPTWRATPTHANYADRGIEYQATRYGGHGYLLHASREYFTPIMFLKDARPASPFIGVGEDVSEHITAAFEATTGLPLPDDITISIVTKDELKRKHEAFGGEWSEGIQGFAVNRKGVSHSIIFVKENALDQLLLVMGHEIGHCMSCTLPSKLDEEAKAFAFELAWMEALIEKDIAGMAASIDLDVRPADNGLHNVAFNFVKRLVKDGRKTMQVFHDLISRNISAGEDHVR